MLLKRSMCVCALLAAAVLGWAGPSSAEPGLLLVAHGAPMPVWNKPVLEFGEAAAEKILATGKYKAVRTAMLEFTEPSIPAMLAELEGEGCDRVVVVPIFVAPSGHTTYDLPAVLGGYTSADIKKTLAEENAEVAKPGVPVLIAETLSGGELLKQFAVDKARELSTDPAKEALVVLMHGDEIHPNEVEEIAKEATVYCCGQLGIDYANWAFVEMGQSFAAEGAKAITKALEEKERVLVVGLYVSSSAQSVAKRGMAMASGAKLMGISIENPLEDEHVVLCQEGMIGHPMMMEWVVETALGALE